MLAVGEGELGDAVGTEIKCPTCGGKHEVQYGNAVASDGTLTPDKLLAFYRCRGTTYLCAVAGRLIQGVNNAES